MASDVLPADRLALFNEYVWHQMGNLHSSAWIELLDATTPRGAAVRAYYRHLLTAPDDILDLVPSGAAD
jgi:hypothetical protein